METKKIHYPDYSNCDFQPRPGEKHGLSDFRKKALSRFKEIGFPTRKSEAWRYFHLDSVLAHEYKAALAPQNSEELQAALAVVPNWIIKSSRFIFLNGRLLHESPSQRKFSGQAGPGIPEEFLTGLSSRYEIRENPFSLLNAAQFEEGFFFKVPKNISIKDPVHFVFLSPSDNQEAWTANPRFVVQAEEGSSARLFFHFLSENSGPSFLNMAVEAWVGANASLDCVYLQKSKSGVEFLSSETELGAGSRFSSFAIACGGALVRNETRIGMTGENAWCDISGLSLLDGKSQAFHHVAIEHRAGHGTSRQVFKNILSENSQAEFDSMVHVFRGAIKSDSEQLDKNILLSENARIYSRPQLRIDADDVRAAHGAATGQLNEKEIFYLQSRGFDKELARLVLMQGFAADMAEKIPSGELRDYVSSEIHGRILALAKQGRGEHAGE